MAMTGRLLGNHLVTFTLEERTDFSEGLSS